MKQCRLCKNMVHEDDLVDYFHLTRICPNCVWELDDAISSKVAKIKDYAKVMHTGRKNRK